MILKIYEDYFTTRDKVEEKLLNKDKKHPSLHNRRLSLAASDRLSTYTGSSCRNYDDIKSTLRQVLGTDYCDSTRSLPS